MAEHPIFLSEKEYQSLFNVAAKQGMTPSEWIVAQLPTEQTEELPLSQRLDGLVGAINSQEEQQLPSVQRTPFGEGIAAKLAKQGIRRP